MRARVVFRRTAVTGYVNYNVIVETIGTVYKQKMKFIIKINNQTGAITSLSKG